MSSPLISLSLDAIGETAWNRLLPADATPFLSFAFLKALEDSGCVSAATGWTPQHLAVRNADGEITHLAPAYIKHHSYGEYVFDWQWARAYEQYRVPYYPKLLLAIPFTPVPGPRILGDVASFPWAMLNDYCHQRGLSGWHLNYPTHLSVPLSAKAPDAHPRLGTQFQWHNDGYTDFTDFVGRFASRKRKNVLKERRRVQEQGITLERVTTISEEQMAFFFECYRDTYLKRGSTPYLSLAFFQTL
ncbi:MAG: peptidogalycan biosysnthesis protein, partial [Pseudomonadota bacterium]|nr:peptidogalycan biosysnthesis protein [Pseudomonadota bacterium]